MVLNVILPCTALSVFSLGVVLNSSQRYLDFDLWKVLC